MATQSKADAMVSGRGQQEAIGGKRAGKRRPLGVALIGALMLALLASVAVSRALPARPADSGAPVQERVIQQDPDADAYAMAQAARPADTFDREQWERTQTSGPAVYTSPCRWGDDGCVSDDAPTPAALPGESPCLLGGSAPCGIQAGHDNGVGTTDDDSACREPGRSCDR
jgi:hypothetical protein